MKESEIPKKPGRPVGLGKAPGSGRTPNQSTPAWEAKREAWHNRPGGRPSGAARAKELGVDRGLFSRYVSGKQVPPASFIDRF